MCLITHAPPLTFSSPCGSPLCCLICGALRRCSFLLSFIFLHVLNSNKMCKILPLIESSLVFLKNGTNLRVLSAFEPEVASLAAMLRALAPALNTPRDHLESTRGAFDLLYQPGCFSIFDPGLSQGGYNWEMLVTHLT